jgi:hypothetical protein
MDDLAKSYLTTDCIDQERILEAVDNHAVQAKGMRRHVQQATEVTVTYRSLEVPHKECEYVIVCD